MSSSGRSVRLFLVDGTPGGLLTAEIINWTGHVVAAPRSDVAALLKRSETSRTGIYLLIGDDPGNLGGSRTYIGEGDEVRERLSAHAKENGGKDFWQRAIVLTSKDTNLTKAHARYLESRFITLAQQASRTKLVNDTSPKPPPLPEADKSDMEFFIAQAKIVLPVLGVNIFRSSATGSVASPELAGTANLASVSPVFELRLKKGGLIARAQEVDGEFTVLEGSLARPAWTGVEDHGYKRLREQVEQDGTLVLSEDGETMRFVHDRVFASPSAAAAVVFGRSANGRNEWRLPGSGMSYGGWQSQSIEQADSEPAS